MECDVSVVLKFTWTLIKLVLYGLTLAHILPGKIRVVLHTKSHMEFASFKPIKIAFFFSFCYFSLFFVFLFLFLFCVINFFFSIHPVALPDALTFVIYWIPLFILFIIYHSLYDSLVLFCTYRGVLYCIHSLQVWFVCLTLNALLNNLIRSCYGHMTLLSRLYVLGEYLFLWLARHGSSKFIN